MSFAELKPPLPPWPQLRTTASKSSNHWHDIVLSIELPRSPRRGSSPPLGQKGVWNDDLGDTNVAYGNKPVGPSGGIPYHAAHVASNQRKFPENAGYLPVNKESWKIKKRLREFLIGRKPAKQDCIKDHKPPNVQSMPGSSDQERKSRTTVKLLPDEEGEEEQNLLRKASQMATMPDATGLIKIYANMDPSESPTSSRETLQSIVKFAKRKSKKGKSHKSAAIHDTSAKTVAGSST